MDLFESKEFPISRTNAQFGLDSYGGDTFGTASNSSSGVSSSGNFGLSASNSSLGGMLGTGASMAGFGPIGSLAATAAGNAASGQMSISGQQVGSTLGGMLGGKFGGIAGGVVGGIAAGGGKQAAFSAMSGLALSALGVTPLGALALSLAWGYFADTPLGITITQGFNNLTNPVDDSIMDSLDGRAALNAALTGPPAPQSELDGPPAPLSDPFSALSAPANSVDADFGGFNGSEDGGGFNEGEGSI